MLILTDAKAARLIANNPRAVISTKKNWGIIKLNRLNKMNDLLQKLFAGEIDMFAVKSVEENCSTPETDYRKIQFMRTESGCRIETSMSSVRGITVLKSYSDKISPDSFWCMDTIAAAINWLFETAMHDISIETH